VFRLLRWLFGLACFASLVYFAATVPLGSKTLLGHLFAIGRTPEARELAKGSREQAGKVAQEVRRLLDEPDRSATGHLDDKAPKSGRAGRPERAAKGTAADRPLERIDAEDRRGLDGVVRGQSAQ
jgi:hypothetical protein